MKVEIRVERTTKIGRPVAWVAVALGVVLAAVGAWNAWAELRLGWRGVRVEGKLVDLVTPQNRPALGVAEIATEGAAPVRVTLDGGAFSHDEIGRRLDLLCAERPTPFTRCHESDFATRWLGPLGTAASGAPFLLWGGASLRRRRAASRA